MPDARKKRAPMKITLAAAVLVTRAATILVRQAGNDGALFSRMCSLLPRLEQGLMPLPSRKLLRRKFKLKVATTIDTIKTARHAVTFREIASSHSDFQWNACRRFRRAARLSSGVSATRFSATRKIAGAAIAHSRKPVAG